MNNLIWIGIWWLSNILIMFGASYYSVVRNQEMNAKKPETETKESKGLLG